MGVGVLEGRGLELTGLPLPWPVEVTGRPLVGGLPLTALLTASFTAFSAALRSPPLPNAPLVLPPETRLLGLNAASVPDRTAPGSAP